MATVSGVKGRETRERVYKAAGESVKNRQLHRQKQDAKSIHFLKVREEAGRRGRRQQTDSQRKDQWCLQRLLTVGHALKD